MLPTQMDISTGWCAGEHISNSTDHLKKEKIDFIEPDMRPPNSLDLNPSDYAVWGALQQRVYDGRKFHIVEEL